MILHPPIPTDIERPCATARDGYDHQAHDYTIFDWDLLRLVIVHCRGMEGLTPEQVSKYL